MFRRVSRERTVQRLRSRLRTQKKRGASWDDDALRIGLLRFCWDDQVVEFAFPTAVGYARDAVVGGPSSVPYLLEDGLERVRTEAGADAEIVLRHAGFATDETRVVVQWGFDG